MLRRSLFAALAAGVLVSCATPSEPPPPVVPSVQDAFFQRLTALCGRAFAGRVVTTEAADAGFASETLVMHVRECSANEIKIPFHVGENRSRTWVITRTANGLRLKHDHRHEDGSEDALTQYGGDTVALGTAARQEFPADEFSKRLFRENNIPVSVDNVWAMEVQPGALFAYELRRPNRHFRVEFDLSTPIAPPPAPWGHD
jgi:hypothetical protein